MKAIKFGDVKVGQQIIFHPGVSNPTIYTKTKPYTMPKGRDYGGKVSEMQYVENGRRRRAFCSDPNYIVYLVEAGNTTL